MRSQKNRKLHPPFRSLPPLRREEGTTHVLEAVIIASIMLSAVAYVATFDSPPGPNAAARDVLARKADDALRILYDTPGPGGVGDSMLSALLLECMQGSCDNLTTRLDNLLPSGAAYALYISNGQQTYPILVTRAPSGEAVTSIHPLEPSWSWNFLAPATDLVDPSKEPLLVYSLPIFNSNPVSMGGSPLLVRVHGTRESDGSDYVLTGFTSTVVGDANGPPLPAASLYFVDGAGAPIAVKEARPDVFAGRNVTLRLRLNETADVPLAPGLEVTVYVPRGWTAVTNETANAGVWRSLENATDRGGSADLSTVRAELLTELRNGTVDFVFDAKYHEDVLDYYGFRAQLSRGAQSSADVLVRADARSQQPDHASPSVHLSAPRPMGRTDTTTWALSAFIPQKESHVDMDDSIFLTRVEIMEQDGVPIFGGVTGVSGPQGTWTSAGDRLTWTPAQTVRLTYSNPAQLTFRVEASGVAGATPAKGPFTAPVTFDSWTGHLVRQIGPGLFRGEFLPANATYGGYNGDTGTLSKLHGLSSTAIYRSTALRGSANYSAGAASYVADSLYGSYVNVERRSVPVGGEVAISSNVQSVLFALAQVGQQAGVTLRFYPPWSGAIREPIFEQQNLDQGLLSGQVTQLAVLDVDGDGFPDPVIGTENGRVIALHGLTGLRLQGDVWSAPLKADVQESGGSARITRLEPIRLGGEDYVVVGMDSNSQGVFVLNRSLQTVWSYPLEDRTVVSLDTSTDVDGDGRKDVLVGAISGLGAGSTDDAFVYVLRALENRTLLVPHAPNPTPGFEDVFYVATGTPSALVGLPGVGPTGAGAGLAVTVQTLLDGGAQLYMNPADPSQSAVEMTSFATPRAGLAAVNASGSMTSTFFGSPVTVARATERDADAVTDVLAGGPGGYVFMMNGTVLTQPIYSYVMLGALTFVDADTRSAVESYALTSDGQVVYTDDGWQTVYSATSVGIPAARAVASPRTNEVWAVGLLGGMWKSASSPLPALLTQPNYLSGIELLPTVPAATRAGAPFNWSAAAVNLTDVWFRGDAGWVVGERCATCDEPLVMSTADGGATWTIATHLDGTLADGAGGAIGTGRLNALKFFGGVGWIAGDDGLLLRFKDGVWRPVATGATDDLRDVSCDPNAPDVCLAVGDNGTLVVVGGATGATPLAARVPMALTEGNATRDLLSVGVVDAQRAYVGSENMVLATFDGGASWTTLPLNYVQNDGRAINVNADGTGFVFGGGTANGRIWFLHDHATQSSATTTSYASRIPSDSRITRVSLLHSNATVGVSSVKVEVSTNGSDWQSMGVLTPPDALDLTADSRDYRLSPKAFGATSGRDFRVRINLTTPGDSTIASAHVRGLTFLVEHRNASGPVQTVEISPDFTTADEADAALTTAAWDPATRGLHMPYVREFWTRNVSGEVHDVRAGFDVTGDGIHDAWVGTGDVLAMNSPDYIIYAGSDENRALHADNRVYLLDGAHGGVVAKTASFAGEVTHVRVSDGNGDGVPERVFATVWNAAANEGELVALDPVTLAVVWRQALAEEEPMDMEASFVPGPFGSVIAGTAASVLQSVVGTPAVERTGFVWGLNGTDGQELWRILPEDMGKYYVTKTIPPEWLFGAYVVEIEVEWRDVVTDGQVSQNVLRSARFYDYFMVTPPDALTPPSPVYNVHLVSWFPDWS